jgi:hypothetical protein
VSFYFLGRPCFIRMVAAGSLKVPDGSGTDPYAVGDVRPQLR